MSIIHCVLAVFISFCLLSVTKGCFIHGTDSGECTIDSTDAKWRQSQMPFCARYIEYPACIPALQELPSSRQWPDGRWKMHTVREKDSWVRKTAKYYFHKRAHEIEMYRPPKALAAGELGKESIYTRNSSNEWGDENTPPVRRFYRNGDCKHAYMAYFCFINFPRCGKYKGKLTQSLPTCRSACENYFISCGFSQDLWRCDKPKWYNSAEGPENPKDGFTPDYDRDYFPGSPFRKNKFKPDGITPYHICTPGTQAAGSRVGGHPGAHVLALFILIVSLLTMIV